MPGWNGARQDVLNGLRCAPPKSLAAAENARTTICNIGLHVDVSELHQALDEIMIHLSEEAARQAKAAAEAKAKAEAAAKREKDNENSIRLVTVMDCHPLPHHRPAEEAVSDHSLFVQGLPQIVRNNMRTEEDDKVMADCLEELKALVDEKLTGQWNVEPFGSVPQGFGTRRSDFDVVMFELNQESDARSILKGLRPVFRNSKSWSVTEDILGAKVRVPILKLRYAGRLGLQEVDLSVNNCQALANTRLLRKYSSINRRVAELGVAVKIWAKEKNICGASNRFLSSYALSLMAIYFLQVTAELPCLKPGKISLQQWQLDRPLKSLFKDFIAFYARTFEWGREVVSVRTGQRQYASNDQFEELGKRTSVRLHIEDPCDRSRNLCDVMTDVAEAKFRAAIIEAYLIDEAFRSGQCFRTELNATPLTATPKTAVTITAATLTATPFTAIPITVATIAVPITAAIARKQNESPSSSDLETQINEWYNAEQPSSANLKPTRQRLLNKKVDSPMSAPCIVDGNPKPTRKMLVNKKLDQPKIAPCIADAQETAERGTMPDLSAPTIVPFRPPPGLSLPGADRNSPSSFPTETWNSALYFHHHVLEQCDIPAGNLWDARTDQALHPWAAVAAAAAVVSCGLEVPQQTTHEDTPAPKEDPVTENKEVRKLEKKLRDISKLEAKIAASERVDPLQLEKIEKKPEIEEELRALKETAGRSYLQALSQD